MFSATLFNYCQIEILRNFSLFSVTISNSGHILPGKLRTAASAVEVFVPYSLIRAVRNIRSIRKIINLSQGTFFIDYRAFDSLAQLTITGRAQLTFRNNRYYQNDN
jgi:hypothetical protein